MSWEISSASGAQQRKDIRWDQTVAPLGDYDVLFYMRY